jgi:hypothetical protein
MIGLYLSAIVGFCATVISGFSFSDGLHIAFGVLIGYYTLTLIGGTILRLAYDHSNETWKTRILRVHGTLARKLGASIYFMSWQLFITGGLLFIGASVLLFFSGSFGIDLVNSNLPLFFTGLSVTIAALVTQQMGVHALNDYFYEKDNE